MASDLSHILQLLQQSMLHSHASYILGAPASNELALFPVGSATQESRAQAAPGSSAPCTGKSRGEYSDSFLPTPTCSECGIRPRTCVASVVLFYDFGYHNRITGQGESKSWVVITRPTAGAMTQRFGRSSVP